MTAPIELTTPRTNRWPRSAGVVAGAAVALTLLVVTFAWPAARGEPEGLAVAVTGDQALVDGFLAGAEEGLGEIVELEQVDSRTAATAGVEDRTYIGALVLTQGAPEVVTASAAGATSASLMAGITQQLQNTLDTQLYGALHGAVRASPDPAAAASQLPAELPTVTLTDLAPYTEGDQNGAGITAAGIPLTVGALLSGLLMSFTIRGRAQRIGAVLGFGVTAGLLLTLTLTTWLEIYEAPFGLVWLALSLSLASTSGLFVGLHAALGRAGIGVAAALTLFAAMPWAAFAVPHQFLPAGLGYFGQWLIPGATTTLARNISYFPEAATAQQWWLLGGWLLLGMLLALRRRA